MDFAFIVPLLALTTLLAVLVFALVNKKKTEERLQDPNAPRSTLASDAPNHASAPPDV